MTRRFINRLRENENVIEVYQMMERSLRTNKHGDLYLQFTLTDKTGSIDARLWNAENKLLTEFEPGCFVAVDGRVQRFQGSIQLIAKTINRVSAEKLNPPTLPAEEWSMFAGGPVSSKSFCRKSKIQT
jgi:3'-5' exoribonuclease